MADLNELPKRALKLVFDMLVSQYGFSDTSSDDQTTLEDSNAGIEVTLFADEEGESLIVKVSPLTHSDEKNVVELIDGLKVDLSIGADGKMNCYEDYEIENLLIENVGDEKYNEMTDSQKADVQQEIPRFCQVLFTK